MRLTDIIDHPRFIGLWTYRAHGKERKFCCSVMVRGEVQETDMYEHWEHALDWALVLISDTE